MELFAVKSLIGGGGGTSQTTAQVQTTSTSESISGTATSQKAVNDENKTAIINKVDKVEGKGLSTNDFTNAKSEQIETNKGAIGTLASLVTTAKDNLVVAVNEVANKFANYVLKTDIVNNVTSSDTDKPLSANQGKVLAEAISNETNARSSGDSNLQVNIDGVNAKISSSASSTNQVLSASEVDSKIALVEARQVYKTNTQGSFATKAELTSATTFYKADGTTTTPTQNDVAYVLADESHDGKLTKYTVASVDPIVWGFVISISEVTFTQAQLDAINSTATTTKIDKIATNETNIGTLANLTTTDKTSLVGATNEVNGKFSSYIAKDGIDNQSLEINTDGNLAVRIKAGLSKTSSGLDVAIGDGLTHDADENIIVKIVDDLTTGGTDKVLSAEQGKTLNDSKVDTNKQAVAGATRSGMFSLVANATSKFFTQVSFTAEESPTGSGASVLQVLINRYTANYATMLCFYSTSNMVYMCSNSNGTITDWRKLESGNVIQDEESITEQTRALLHTNNPTNGHIKLYPRVRFITAESPNGSDNSSYAVYEHRNSDTYGSIIAVNTASNNIYVSGLVNGTWNAWTTLANSGDLASYLPLSGGTMTGAITADTVSIIKSAVDDSAVGVYGGTDSSSAGYELYGKYNQSFAGCFKLQANDGSNVRNLIGYPDGKLRWDGVNIALESLTGALSDLVTTAKNTLVAAINECKNAFANYVLKTDIVDNLTSTDTDKPLSANQGKTLKTSVDTKIDTAGTGLSKSGTTLNHSNSVTANTTSGLKFFTFDAQGHITAATNKTLGRGLSDSSNTIGHSNSVTAMTTAKFGKVKYDAQGHITGFTEMHLYWHNITVLYSTATLQTGWVISTSDTAFTIETFAKWLYDNGFTSMALVYAGCAGENTNVTRYVASSSGGAVTTSASIVTIASGWYSEDGTNLKCKGNWNQYWNINSAFTDTVLTIY